MKLYFSPGACSLSPHIALREAGLPFDAERVDIKTHKTASGRDYYGVNPKGSVPALELDSGEILTEGPAVVQYVADQKPESNLAPKWGTLERYRLQEWLNFITTELHKAFSPLFHSPSDEVKKQTQEKLMSRFTYVAKSMEGKPYLMGPHFTVADGYLFVMLRWAQRLAPDVHKIEVLHAYFDRVDARPAVKAALDFEASAAPVK